MLAKPSPLQYLSLGYALIALLGAVVLALPVSVAGGAAHSFVDALFTATSAITTTGLVVVDTGSFYSLFGQGVILFLIQVGGLGYMICFGLILYFFKFKPTLGGRIAFQQSLAGFTLSNSKTFLKAVILLTFCVELAGALMLAFIWRRDFSPLEAIYQGAFHSISAFCTAGFSLFPDSLSGWRDDWALNAVVLVVMVVGTIGFFVLFDIGACLFKKKRKLSVHSGFAIAITAVLIAAGSALVFVSEPEFEPSSYAARALSAVFQSGTASTTGGFNTVDIGALSATSLFVLIILMFIGASSGGTGGGIKTTTLGTVLAAVWTVLCGRKDIGVFKRRIPGEVFEKAMVITTLSALVVLAGTLVLTVTEAAPFLNLLFEVVSALATAGLSTGVTPHLTVSGKIVISIIMLIGRISPLALGVSLAGERRSPGYRYTEAEVFVG